MNVPLVAAQTIDSIEIVEGVMLNPIEISPAIIKVNERLEVQRASIFDASLSKLPEEYDSVVYT